ncbi:3',5'-cyclic adenosine monophosphate phosphodiesterase CpdA [Gemmata sp. SH-PL17]|uniref:metallophosphoesterase family protein n=1 Tax=Gemmata sp. SH-PL17 TaxID=1630693 RepID=UPI0004B2E5D4|nr:metallophosphoesterase [Gemmata sp. SH-PL17]AMV23598.1 3',5'-cyclic adenosine monophosphate phosphodiesterase CpdA [Gemmata sp. SH-PL17]
MTSPSRRDLFGAAIGAAALPGFISTARAADRKPVLRAAHITDVHITKDREAPQGVAAMFSHMASQKDGKPELILNTGDAVMSVDGKTTGAKAAEHIAVWKEAVKSAPAPIYSCLGNHDVWDGNEPTDAIPAEKKGFALMTGVLGMPAPYYSFDKNGWHFVSLNSMCNWPKYATLSPEHFDWLKADLAKTKLPTVVLSHVPILSVTSQVYGDGCRKNNDNVVPGVWHHADCWAISEVFRKNPHVKLCLSGHMHTCDRCEYRGVWYICGGAACGAWWGGSEYGFPPCYGKLDLFADGTFSYDFVDYGWKARKWQGKELKD